MHDGETAARSPAPKALQRHQALFLYFDGILV